MGEIRIVGPGKTRGYPYPVCKKDLYFSGGSGNFCLHMGCDSSYGTHKKSISE